MSTPDTAPDSPPATPPAARHFDVYEYVAIQGHSTRQAAQKFKISQTRVCQLVHQVVAFMGEVMPPILEQIPESRRLILSKNVAALRLEHLYNTSLAAWKASGGENWKVREPLRPGSLCVRTTWKECGKVTYLTQALKISRAAMEAAIPIPIGILAEEDEDEQLAGAEPQDCDLSDDQPNPTPVDEAAMDERIHKLQEMVVEMRSVVSQLPPVDAAPPNGDCSEKEAKSAAADGSAGEPAPQLEETQAIPAPSPAGTREPQLHDSALFSDRAPAPAVEPDLPIERRLSRAQRRARQRQAERHLMRRRQRAATGPSSWETIDSQRPVTAAMEWGAAALPSATASEQSFAAQGADGSGAKPAWGLILSPSLER